MTTNCTSPTISSDSVCNLAKLICIKLYQILLTQIGLHSVLLSVLIPRSQLHAALSWTADQFFAGMPSNLCCWLAVQLNRKTPLESTVAIYCWFNLIFNLLKKMFQWKVIIFSEDQATGSCSWTWGQLFDVWVLGKNQTKNIERKLRSLCGYQVAINTASTVLSLNPRAGVV